MRLGVCPALDLLRKGTYGRIRIDADEAPLNRARRIDFSCVCRNCKGMAVLEPLGCSLELGLNRGT